MGNSYASNTAKESIVVLNEVVNKAVNDCKLVVTQSQIASFSGITGGTLNVNSNWTQQAALDLGCVADNKFQTAMNNSLAQSAKQTAEAVVQQFSLATFSEATNYVELSMKASNIVQNTFYNSCLGSITQNQTIVFSDISNTNIAVGLNWSQTTDAVTNCIFNNSTVNGIQNDMSQAISQAATAKQENFLTGILVAIVIFIAILGLLLFGILGLGIWGVTKLVPKIPGGGGGGGTVVVPGAGGGGQGPGGGKGAGGGRAPIAPPAKTPSPPGGIGSLAKYLPGVLASNPELLALAL